MVPFCANKEINTVDDNEQVNTPYDKPTWSKVKRLIGLMEN